MRANSLAVRLFLWATAWTVVILIATGIALSTLYRHAVERAAAGRALAQRAYVALRVVEQRLDLDACQAVQRDQML